MRLEPLIKVWKASSGPLIVNPNGNKPNALATFFFAGLYCLYQKPSISYVSWPEKFLSKTPFSYLLMILDLSSVFMGKKYNSLFIGMLILSFSTPTLLFMCMILPHFFLYSNNN